MREGHARALIPATENENPPWARGAGEAGDAVALLDNHTTTAVESISGAKLVEVIHAEHEAAIHKARDAIEHARRCGEMLIKVKSSLKHGGWLPWLNANITFSESTAQRYMQVASRWDDLQQKSRTVRDLTMQGAIRALCVAPTKKTRRRKSTTKAPARTQRWASAIQLALDALRDLAEMQQEFQTWLDGLPENLAASAVADKLQMVVDLDLQAALDIINEAQNADLPLGFGRD